MTYFQPLDFVETTNERNRYSEFYFKGQNLKKIFNRLIEEIVKVEDTNRKKLSTEIAAFFKKDKTTIEKFIYYKDYYPPYLLHYLLCKLPNEMRLFFTTQINGSIEYGKTSTAENWTKFPKEFNKELSWLSGAIAADGWISKDKGGKERLGVVDHFEDSIRLVSEKINLVFGFNSRVAKLKKEDAWQVIVDNKFISRFFTRFLGFNYGKKTYTICESKVVKDSNFRLDYASGVLTFDGSVELDGIVSIWMRSPKMLEDIHEILNANGLTINFVRQKRGKMLKSRNIMRLSSPEKWIALFSGTSKAKRLNALRYGHNITNQSEKEKLFLLKNFIGKSNSSKYSMDEIYKSIRKHKSISRKELVKKFEFGHATIYGYTKLMRDFKLINITKIGRETFYAATFY